MSTRRAVQEATLVGVRGRVARGLLLSGVPEVGAGQRFSMLQAGDRKNTGSPQGKDNYLEDGAHGCGQLGEVR